jgi:hypothetical protein
MKVHSQFENTEQYLYRAVLVLLASSMDPNHTHEIYDNQHPASL